MNAPVILQFSTEAGWQSGLIRWYTDWKYSHVDFRLTDGSLLGARMDGGVLIRKPGYSNFSDTRLYVVDGADYDAWLKVLKTQLGKPYDKTGLFSTFVFNRDWRSPDSWFCSELQAWAAEQCGSPLLNPEIPVNQITPKDLALSPRTRALAMGATA
jgi:hypothetical protein